MVDARGNIINEAGGAVTSDDSRAPLTLDSMPSILRARRVDMGLHEKIKHVAHRPFQSD